MPPALQGPSYGRMAKLPTTLASEPILSYFECRSRSPMRRLFDKITVGNIAWAVIMLFLVYISLLWTYTFSTAGMRLGFLAWFHPLYVPFKYTRLLGNIYGNMLYRCKPIASKPKYTGKDVTVIVPTITENMEELVSPFQSLIDTGIHELIIVTVGQSLHDKCTMLARRLMLANPGKAKVKVYSINERNKRIQLKAVIPFVTTDICALVDDDIWWKKTALPWILAPFEDPSMGSVGVGMAACPLPEGRGFNLKTMYHYLGAEYLTRRNFDGASTLYHDAGISCMSGRTNALRTSIIKDPAFLDAFVSERDLSRPDGPLLLTGEDKFITRWLVDHGIGMWVQYHPDAYLETTLDMDSGFLQQCSRWASSSWRGNYKLIFPEGFTPWTVAFWKNIKKVSYKQPWTFFAKYIVVFLSWTLITDPLFFVGHYSCQKIFADAGFDFLTGTSGWCIAIAFYLFTKIVKKLKDLYLQDPWTILFFPLSLAFGLFHNWIKFKTFVEIDQGWRTRGSEVVADTDVNKDFVWCVRAILMVVIILVEWTVLTVFQITTGTLRLLWTCSFGLFFRAGHSQDTVPLLQVEIEEEQMDAAELQRHRPDQEKDIPLMSIEDEQTPCSTSGCDCFRAAIASA